MTNVQWIECVPNFSEGRDLDIIEQIKSSIVAIPGVRLLNVDPGRDTNRTVVTFVGTPQAVIEAAFASIKKASELIDMSNHSGEHPRMGATDVCPLVPVSGISMDEVIELSKQLAERVANELNIPVYLYENSAKIPSRRNLANIRAGEYEALPQKLENPAWAPDFGRPIFNKKAGATVIGARNFLVAYNVNLNTRSVRRANSVAFDVREKGRVKRIGNPITGTLVRDEQGEPVRIPGTCKDVKAIGWYIEEYGIAQISMNLTNLEETPLHVAFEECCKSADTRGLRVTGSELVGLVPKDVLVDAGKYFLQKQKRSSGISENDIIQIAVKSLGLDELGPFEPQKRILEFLLDDSETKHLQSLSLKSFADMTASESPAPGGGSISAYVGALAVSLATMVANLSANKRGWDDRWQEFSEVAEKGQALKDQLLRTVDEDTHAFNQILGAMRLPKSNPEQIKLRKEALSGATKYAIEVPLGVMRLCLGIYDLLKKMALNGNPNSITDAGVGVHCATAAINGAALNVRINCQGFDDDKYVSAVLAEAVEIVAEANARQNEILSAIDEVLSP